MEPDDARCRVSTHGDHLGSLDPRLDGADLLAFLIEVDAGVAGLGSGAARASEGDHPSTSKTAIATMILFGKAPMCAACGADQRSEPTQRR